MAEVKERPILFSGPMVRALQDGRKTQTRRIVKPQPNGESVMHCNQGWSEALKCPYGTVGDQLWVRETWAVGKPFDGYPSQLPKPNGTEMLAVDYAANPKRIWSQENQGKWRASIHMPRWASRITLEITGVRVERLQDISEGDAKAEGAALSETIRGHKVYHASHRAGFAALWQSIHGLGSWKENPFVWVISFCRLVK